MGRLPSLTTVLVHEVDRYNILLKKIHTSIENVQRAIKGFVVMSEELENVVVAFINNQVFFYFILFYAEKDTLNNIFNGNK